MNAEKPSSLMDKVHQNSAPKMAYCPITSMTCPTAQLMLKSGCWYPITFKNFVIVLVKYVTWNKFKVRYNMIGNQYCILTFNTGVFSFFYPFFRGEGGQGKNEVCKCMQTQPKRMDRRIFFPWLRLTCIFNSPCFKKDRCWSPSCI